MGSISTLGACVATAGALAALIGCGGEEQPGRTATVARGETVEVTGTEYAFDPETVVVEDGGEALEITLDNQGSLPHNLTVFEGAAELGTTATIQGSDSDSTTIEIGPGTYRMVCTVGDHEELGMVGELELR